MARWITRKPGYFSSIKDALPQFLSRSCRLVAMHYAHLLEQGGGAIPAKNGLDMTGFGPAMSNIALGAISLGESCRFRIVGETIRECFSINLVGANYYDLVPGARRDQAIQSMDMLVNTPCGFRADMLHRYENGTEKRAEVCGFPLISTEQGVDGFVILTDEELKRDRRLTASPPPLHETIIVKRDLIDIGFGLDKGFADLVPRDLVPE